MRMFAVALVIGLVATGAWAQEARDAAQAPISVGSGKYKIGYEGRGRDVYNKVGKEDSPATAGGNATNPSLNAINSAINNINPDSLVGSMSTLAKNAAALTGAPAAAPAPTEKKIRSDSGLRSDSASMSSKQEAPAPAAAPVAMPSVAPVPALPPTSPVAAPIPVAPVAMPATN